MSYNDGSLPPACNGCSTLEINRQLAQKPVKALQEAKAKFDSFEKNQKEQVKTERKNNLLKFAAFLIGDVAAAFLVMAIMSGKFDDAKKIFQKALKSSDLKFDKGIAKTKTGELFSGKVKDTLKNGDKVIREYKDGKIVSSTRKGTQNFVKEFVRTQSNHTSIPFETTKIYNKVDGEIQKSAMHMKTPDVLEIWRDGNGDDMTHLIVKNGKLTKA